MSKTLEPRPLSILVPAIEEVPRISDTEREVLRASLAQARTDIAAGDYDVLTPETLRAEFDGIFQGDKTDEELDAALEAHPAPKR